MRTRTTLFVAAFSLCLAASAQVHVEQDAQIGKIVGGKKQQQQQTAPTQPKPAAPKPVQENPATSPSPAQPKNEPVKVTPSLQTNQGTATSAPRQPKRKGLYTPRQRYNAQGYRVQIYTGGNKRKDRLEAQKMMKRCKETFPELSAYVHFVSPHWVCRIGDFRRREDAQRYVKKANEKLTFEARIVRSNIFIAR